ncbi:MAG TPA: argininosuccinate synthase [Gemmatimonadota bacterium]|nr:argininosuccinate synthase [Gemmatimonadota bacterium]
MQTVERVLALAFSGGLDTSFCVPRLAESGWRVHTVHVDTGGATAEERAAIRTQALATGAAEHHAIDARQPVFDRFVRVLVQANVLRGGVYPLSVAAERTQQAIAVVEVARAIGARAVGHGSTGAGNDQVRFDVAFRALAPELEIVTPVRDASLSREAAIGYLEARGLPVPPGAGSYSVNRGLWGSTWGGGWTHDPWCPPPAEMIDPPASAPAPVDVVVDWERGVPVALDGIPAAGPDLVADIAARAAAYGIGRGIHIGETALGIKGRIGFEAGAAHVLIPAHRELEKLVLTRWQSFWKDQLAQFYGDRLHEGQWFDPALRDIEALIESSQARVTGQTRVRLAAGRAQVVAARSPHSLLDPALATYGEESRFWTGADARSFALVAAIPSLLAARAANGAVVP